MFTGVIKGTGKVIAFEKALSLLTISSPLFLNHPSLKAGTSIAVDGICLTASKFDDLKKDMIGFFLGQETKNVSLLARKKPSDLVNIEFALLANHPLDGHLVQGHVDGISELLETKKIANDLVFRFSLPKDLALFITTKGSIAINGVSLTVNKVELETFEVCLVPFTIEQTTFKNLKKGDLVHIETDIIGRYLHRFYTADKIRPSFLGNN